MHAELDAVICAGPRRGKQFTYGLFEELAPKAKKVSREEALGKLALKYFSGHGPAQVKDFAWWSGLNLKDAQKGLELTKRNLVEETVEGKTYWFSDKTKKSKSKNLQAFLLSIYDEYTIGYKDRTALGEQRYFEKLILMGNALTAVMVLDGKIVGTWKKEKQRKQIKIKLNPFKQLEVAEREAFERAVERYGKFIGSYAYVLD